MPKGIREVLDTKGIVENIFIDCLRIFDLTLHICNIDFKIQNPISFKSVRVEEIADSFRERFSFILDLLFSPGEWDETELSCLLGEKEQCKKFKRWEHLKGIFTMSKSKRESLGDKLRRRSHS